MLGDVLPGRLDDGYRGYRSAVWLLTAYLLGKAFAGVTAMGLNPLWSNRQVLQSVEGFPLSAFGAAETDAALLLYAWWGGCQLVLAVLGLAAVARYRALVPLMYVLAAVEKIAMTVLTDISPAAIAAKGAPAPLVVAAVLLIGLAMSLTHRTRRPTAGNSPT
jgi:hypothetical protein